MKPNEYKTFVDDKFNKKFLYKSGSQIVMGLKPDESSVWTGIHETLHILGLSDRYDQYLTPARVTMPMKGFKDDIMGNYGSWNISQTHYNNLGQFILSQDTDEFILKHSVDKDDYGNLK